MIKEINRYLKILQVFLLNILELRKYITNERPIFKYALLNRGYPIYTVDMTREESTKQFDLTIGNKVSKWTLYGKKIFDNRQ